ncbi:MAG: histidine--tRNA ligase [Alphaproteobacteria bacterium]|nr:histidine--tRNA ligase [Alphaproteobacteria bacterium]
MTGTIDLLPSQMRLYNKICETFFAICKLYGYEEVATPILEDIRVFDRNLGLETDVVSKEMFFLEKKQDETLVLRPENTAGVMRLCQEGGLFQKLPQRLAYYGPMFRYERPQKGRYRQFHQFGVECIGVASYMADVENIQMAVHFMQEIGLAELTELEIHTLGSESERDAYKQALHDYLLPYKNELSENSVRRFDKNILRVLDSKNVHDQKILETAPVMRNFLQMESAKYFDNILESLENFGISYTVNPFLVRGLDYYNQTVFEIKTPALGAQSAVLGGGRYDGLAQQFGEKTPTPSIGWAAGMERLFLLAQEHQTLSVPPRKNIVIIAMTEAFDQEAQKYASLLRKEGIACLTVHEGTLRKRMKIASRLEAKYTIIFAPKEMENKTAILRDMMRSEERILPLADLIITVKKHYDT